MRKLYLLLILTVCMTGIVSAQDWATDKAAQAEVKKLAFLVGEWRGSGWMMGVDRMKQSFEQTEHIHFKLDSTAILDEFQRVLEDNTVHQSLNILTYKGEDGLYDFQSFLPSGQKSTFKSELKGKKLFWYPRDFIRYTIQLDDQGRLFEKGEINKGGNWYQFSESILEKVN